MDDDGEENSHQRIFEHSTHLRFQASVNLKLNLNMKLKMKLNTSARKWDKAGT